MANEEHLALLKKGVAAWNTWRQENRRIAPDLSHSDLCSAGLDGVDLRGANLREADLRGANLEGGNLRGAHLSNAMLDSAKISDGKLRKANLRGASLVGTDLRRAELGRVNLRETRLDWADLIDANLRSGDLQHAEIVGTDLRGADLTGANLRSAALTLAHLEGTDFSGVIVGDTKFATCDLSEAIGLLSIIHEGPSTIGLDTIYKSKGEIPESFLRGCGVPDSFIAQMHSLVGAEDGIQFYSCFISYSSKDEEFARRLHGRMRDAHLRVWFAPEDIQGGKKLHEQIETAIRVYDKLLIALSEASLQSEWVMDELRKGFKAERESGKRKLFPVRLTDYETLQRWECRDSLSGKDLAEEVREYFIPDFSRWKEHDQFEAAFDRLLKDLKSEG
jgi:hypothetical protein